MLSQDAEVTLCNCSREVDRRLSMLVPSQFGDLSCVSINIRITIQHFMFQFILALCLCVLHTTLQQGCRSSAMMLKIAPVAMFARPGSICVCTHLAYVYINKRDTWKRRPGLAWYGNTVSSWSHAFSPAEGIVHKRLLGHAHMELRGAMVYIYTSE